MLDKFEDRVLSQDGQVTFEQYCIQHFSNFAYVVMPLTFLDRYRAMACDMQ